MICEINPKEYKQKTKPNKSSDETLIFNFDFLFFGETFGEILGFIFEIIVNLLEKILEFVFEIFKDNQSN